MIYYFVLGFDREVDGRLSPFAVMRLGMHCIDYGNESGDQWVG